VAIDINNVPEYTDADILKVLRAALVNSATAQAYSYDGLMLSRYNPEQIHRLIRLYEDKIATANGGGGFRTALARFGRTR
jgi:hypothetical protein